MTDLSAMHAEITDDLNRTDLSANIITAIKRAVLFYNDTRTYWFHEERVYTDVATASAYYSLPSDFDSLDLLSISENSDVYVLQPKPDAYIEDHQDDGITAIPEYYSIYDDQVRLFPTPDRSLTLTMHYKKNLADVSASSSSSLNFTNAFFTEGYDLIRFRAEFDLYTNKLHNAEMAQACKIQERECEVALNTRHRRRKATGKIQKHL